MRVFVIGATGALGWHLVPGLVAIGNSILTICWHRLSDPDARFTDLGPHWHAGSHPSGAIASSSANWNA
jgi:nucleoside-diphosphate-sugar epimerase